jgi:hypothetical protein
VLRVRTAERRGLIAAQYPKLLMFRASAVYLLSPRQQPADYFVGNSGASDAIWQEGNFDFTGSYPLTNAQER